MEKTSPTAIENITQREINEYLYGNLPISLIVTFILSTIVLIGLSGYEKTASDIWYGFVLIVIVLRVCLLVWYKKTKSETKLQKFHSNLFVVGSSVAAVLWGTLGSFLMPANIFYQTFIIIYVAGIIAGSSISLGARYLASITFVWIALLPIIAWIGIQILHGNRPYWGILIAMSMYLLYSSTTARKNSELVIKNINLKNKNIDLVNHLTKYLNQIELYSQMGEALDKCRGDKDIGKICKKYLPNIFLEFSGGIFLFSAESKRLKALELWGEFSSTENLEFPQDECVACKTKNLYISHDMERCAHSPASSGLCVCMPLQTPVKFFGVLHLKLRSDIDLQKEDFISYHKALLTRVATTIAFSLGTIQYEKLLEEEATHDTLTGLYNRRYLDTYFSMELSKSKRKSTSISILMIDIDHFKRFNDKYGHEMGDTVLHEVGLFLKNNIRGSDFACRYGGEEFLIILPESNLEVARERAETIREGIKRISILKDGKPIPGITVSIGVAVFPQQRDTEASIIEAADKAMYRAKNEGRDRVCE